MNNERRPQRPPLIRITTVDNGQVIRLETPWITIELSRGAILFVASTLISLVLVFWQ